MTPPSPPSATIRGRSLFCTLAASADVPRRSSSPSVSPHTNSPPITPIRAGTAPPRRTASAVARAVSRLTG